MRSGRVASKRQSVLVRSACMSAVALGMAAAAFLSLPNEPARAAAQDAASVEPATVGGLPGFRRLNEQQYIRSIEAIFGPGLTVPGRFDPPLREGLMAIGDGLVAVSPSGFEQYELRAREISAQLFAEGRRKTLLTCVPQAVDKFDQACATQFFGKYGRLLYRRPLSAGEMASVMGVAMAATEKDRNFYNGLQAGLSRLLVSPKFLFRVERGEPDPKNPSVHLLDGYSLATRLSFLFWDAPPDEELLDAAGRGELRDHALLAKQVDRMIASPRFEQGVRSFFSDMFGYEQFAGLAKDQAIYPKFNSEIAKDAREQTLRTVVDHLIARNGDYRDLFTTKRTFLNRSLGALYRVPVPEAGIGGWTPYTFAEEDPRAGILTLAGFLMLDPTHEGRSSPTIRGKTVRELLLCQTVPLPPANVNFSVVQDVNNPNLKTARQRLTIHQENPVCAGCHALTDPIGLSMENYDSIGNFRSHENGAEIDATGKFEGKPYKGLIGFTQVLRDSPAVPACVVKRAYEYGVGRATAEQDEKWLDFATERFAQDKYQFPTLLRRIATSRAFSVVATEPAAAPATVTAAK